ncbi:MAG: hypothetical protein JST00_39535 [Deltaproteobacteria bacterium]|nr:hypothetical protein [Deltaproteobacteria bacterium]
MVVTQLETPRFGAALLAVVTFVLLGLAGVCFAIALFGPGSTPTADPGILSVAEAAAAVQAETTRATAAQGASSADVSGRARSVLWAPSSR